MEPGHEAGPGWSWTDPRPPPPPSPTPADDRPRRSPPTGGGPNWLLIGGLVLLAVVFVVGIVAVMGGGPSDDTGHDAGEVAAADAGADAAPTTIPTSFPPPPAVPVPPGGFSAQQLADVFGDAVYRVEAAGCGIDDASGTAFAISPYHLVTNWHVVVFDTEPVLVSRGGERLPGHVIGMSQTPDVAVVQVDEPLPRYLEWAPAASLQEGQPLVAMGYPLPALDFTVNQLTIASFETEGDRRTGIRVDGRIDRGNSGGPSLTVDGKVAGVNTSANVNPGAAVGGLSGGGLQVVPYLAAYDGLQASIDAFLTDTSGTTVPPDCTKAGPGNAMAYGDNPELDAIWDLCDQGVAAACDVLSLEANPRSDYYDFGVTCGAREPVQGYCAWRWGPELPPRAG
jgi:hypothetical protein